MNERSQMQEVKTGSWDRMEGAWLWTQCHAMHIAQPREEWQKSRTANEGPVRIQNKCLVPMYVFPEKKLFYFQLCAVSLFLHSYICERFIYFKDRSAYSAAGKYVDRS